MPTTRERIVALAQLYVGCGVTKQEKRYVDLLMRPEDPPKMRVYYADRETSGCGLFLAGLLRLMGYQDGTLLRDPYAIGYAMIDLDTVALRAKAYRSNVHDLALPGDLVRVGGGSDGGGPEHIFLVKSIERDPDIVGWKVIASEGGQLDEKGNQIILESTHRWFYSLGVLWDEHGTTRRKVRKVIDIECLPLKSEDEEQDK